MSEAKATAWLAVRYHKGPLSKSPNNMANIESRISAIILYNVLVYRPSTLQLPDGPPAGFADFFPKMVHNFSLI